MIKWQILSICAVVAISYWRTIFYGYVIDDMDVKDKSAGLPHKTKLQLFWWQIIGKKYVDPKVEHGIVMAIHAINCLLIYFAFGKDNIGFMTALFFAVNPAGTQGSVWISGKCYALSAMAVLLMWLFKWVSPLLYIAALRYCALTGGPAFVLYVFSFWPLCLMVLPAWYWRKRLFPGQIAGIAHRYSSSSKDIKRFQFRNIILYLKTLGYYIKLGLFPWHLGVFHPFMYCHGVSKKDTEESYQLDRYFYIGLFTVFVLITNLIWNRTPAIFGLFWFVLFISPWCNFIQLQQFIGERYLYLPLIGLMYFLANMIQAIPWPYNMLVFGWVFLCYWLRLQWHLPSYKNIDNQIMHNLMNFPEMYACYTWLGNLANTANAKFIALEWWFKGWKLRPVDFRLNNNIAVMLADLGFLDDAEKFLKAAEDSLIEENKKDGLTWINSERQRIAILRKLKRR